MNVLSSLMDLQVQKTGVVIKALTLVNVALESGGASLSHLMPLVDLLRGDVCRHLLRASQSDDLEVFSLALRVVFNLFMSIKDHMKVQLEVFLTSVHLRLLQHNLTSTSSTNSTSISTSVAKEELALESLLEFCREPALMHDIYVNYDCDVQCTNLFDSIITVLCAKAVPNFILTKKSLDNIPNLDSKVHKITILHKLALDGVLAVLQSITCRCVTTSRMDTDTPSSRSSLDVPLDPTQLALEDSPLKQLSGKHLVQRSAPQLLSPLPENGINGWGETEEWPVQGEAVETADSRPPSPVQLMRSFSDGAVIGRDAGVAVTGDEGDDGYGDFAMMARARTAHVLISYTIVEFLKKCFVTRIIYVISFADVASEKVEETEFEDSGGSVQREAAEWRVDQTSRGLRTSPETTHVKLSYILIVVFA